MGGHKELSLWGPWPPQDQHHTRTNLVKLFCHGGGGGGVDDGHEGPSDFRRVQGKAKQWL